MSTLPSRTESQVVAMMIDEILGAGLGIRLRPHPTKSPDAIAVVILGADMSVLGRSIIMDRVGVSVAIRRAIAEAGKKRSPKIRRLLARLWNNGVEISIKNA